jgi:hypothetical protein
MVSPRPEGVVRAARHTCIVERKKRGWDEGKRVEDSK